MSRTKHTLQAPEGAEESQIGGTYYWPDVDTGQVETTNEDHVKVLVQHGYKVVGSVSIMRPQATQRGPIDIDELGRAQLQAALEDRGLTYPVDATRAELSEVAHGWNMSQRRKSNGATEAQVAATPGLAPAPAAAAAPAVEVAAAATPAVDDGVEQMSYQDLRGWLVARGVVTGKNPGKPELVALVRQHMAKTEKAA